MVLGMDLEIFAVYFVRKLYYHLCLNLNNSKIWRRVAEIFSEIVQTYALYKTYAENPRNIAPFLGKVPLKRDIQQKLQFSRPPCTNCVRG